MNMEPPRVFLTGDPGCGKTIVIRRTADILTARGRKPGGIISGEIRHGGVRIGFSLEDLMTHETGILAHIDQKEGPQVGKYRVNLSDIQRIGVTAIRRAITEADVVIVDELGPMELHSKPFILAVEMALASPKHLVGTIHRRASHYLIAAIKSNRAYRIIEVTLDNRSRLPNEIVEQLTEHA
jgi:nucleoside-triphosphatase